jgi:hypothetical protein
VISLQKQFLLDLAELASLFGGIVRPRNPIATILWRDFKAQRQSETEKSMPLVGQRHAQSQSNARIGKYRYEYEMVTRILSN